MQFDQGTNPLNLTLANDTIGETFFNGQSGYYIDLENGAFFAPGFPTIINGEQATYEGFRLDTVSFLTQAQHDYYESKFHDFNDDATLGLILIPAVPDLDNNKFFDDFADFNGHINTVSITLLGLPKVSATQGGLNFSSANALNAIQTAAGGDSNAPLTPEQLNNIESAAGEETNGAAPAVRAQSANCWNDALSGASPGHPVNYSFGGSFGDASLASAGSCSGSSL